MRQDRVIEAFALLLSILLLCGTIVSSAIIPREISFPRNTIGTKVEARAPLLRRKDVTPPVPDVETCKSKLTVPKDKAVFYSSAVIESAKAYASSIGGVTIWEAGFTNYEQELFQQAQQAIKDGKETWGPVENDQFRVNMSKAFAQLASGEVPVVLPAGANGDPYLPTGSFFTLYEYDILKDSSQNAGVTKVIAFAGKNDKSSPDIDAGKTIWPCS